MDRNRTSSEEERESGEEGTQRSESGLNTPPRKKRKLHYDQKYQKSWEKDSSYTGWLQESRKGELYFYCKACKCDLKCAGGRFILNKHSSSSKHVNNIKGLASQPSIKTFGTQSNKSFDDKVKSAEIKMACFLAKHNLSFNIAGDLKTLIQDVCPDSNIAKALTFEKTKAQSIVSNVTGKLSHDQLVETLKTEKFSLIVDESTDKSTTKHLALIARTAIDFDVEDNFLCLIPIVDGTASALHNKCKEYLVQQNIPYTENMIGFAADGANTMFGQHHSLSTLFADEIPHLFMMKCICHSFHLCASYACKTLPRGVEDFARDVYNYIQNSPKRQGDYKEFQCFVDVKPHKLLHPAQTRWLSLLPVVNRLIEQLPALKLYFQSAVLNDRLLAAQTILEKCMNPSTELYLHFLGYVLPYFHDINKEMQAESPKLYLLYERIFMIYKTMLDCFIKPDLLQLTQDEKNRSKDHDLDVEQKILNLDFENKENHLPIEEVYLGGNVISLLLKPDFLGKITEMEIRQFKEKCILFYIESTKQIRQRFCFEDKKKFKCLKFMNPQHIIERNAVPSIAHLGALFPGLCPENLTELDREWRFLRNMALPCNENDANTPEKFWRYVSTIKKGDHSSMFPLLCGFVKKILALPHSSANVERLFSSVNNLKTKQRNKLCTETLEGLLHTKRFISKSGEPNPEHLKLFNKNMYKHHLHHQ